MGDPVHIRAVSAGQAGRIDGDPNPAVCEGLNFARVAVPVRVALGVGQDPGVPRHLQIKNDLLVVHGRLVESKFEQHALHRLTELVNGMEVQEVVGSDAIREMFVEEVLGGQLECEARPARCDRLLQLLKSRNEREPVVRVDVGVDVGRHHGTAVAHVHQPLNQFEGFFEGGAAVVHARNDVRVHVDVQRFADGHFRAAKVRLQSCLPA